MAAIWQKIKEKRRERVELKRLKQIQDYIDMREELLFQLKLLQCSNAGKKEKELQVTEELHHVTSRLEKYNVTIMKGQKMDKYEEEKHEVIAKQEVDGMEYHNRILEVYGDGYEYQGTVIRKMHVMTGYVK